MQIEFRKVLPNEYELLNYAQKIVVEEHANQFAILRVNNKDYGLTWYGDMITPVIEYNEHFDLFLIGVNKHVSAISGEDGRVVFCIGLSDSFSFFLKYEGSFVIVTETTITMINGRGLSVSKLIVVPDIIVDCSIVNDVVSVQTLDNNYIF